MILISLSGYRINYPAEIRTIYSIHKNNDIKGVTLLLNGIDVLIAKNCSLLDGRKIGLITNHTGITKSIQPNWQVLLESTNIKLKALFSPEHGFFGSVQDTLKVASYIHKPSGLPIFSLFDNTSEPTAEMLSEIDTLVFDIQDVGVRFYTYGVTMVNSYKKALEHNLDFIILDWPNPLGRVIRGNILEKEAASFLGLENLAWQHGLTLGELGLLYSESSHPPLVIRCEDYDPKKAFTSYNLPWVAPSPNIPSLNTIKVYPGTCLFEGTNVSEGRGTTQPFEIIGAPFLNGHELSLRLNSLNIPGAYFRAVEFIPTFWRYQDIKCEGVCLHIIDDSTFDPVYTGIAMISHLLNNCPEFKINTARFNALAGKRLYPLLSMLPPKEIQCHFENELNHFRQKTKPFLLY